MSRKAREDKSAWKTPSVHAFVGDYGPFRTRECRPIEQVLVILCNERSGGGSGGPQRHAMYDFAGPAQRMLLGDIADGGLPETISNGVLVVGVGFAEDDEGGLAASLERETEEAALTKGFGRALFRLFQRLLVQKIVLAAEGELCGLALKLHRALREKDQDIVAELHFLLPVLTSKFINAQFGAPPVEKKKKKEGKKKKGGKENAAEVIQQTPLRLLVEETNSRVDILRGVFPVGETRIVDPLLLDDPLLGFAPQTGDDESIYDPTYCNHVGKSLFATRVTVEMNRVSKQYERNCEDVTNSLTEMIYDPAAAPTSDGAPVDWSACERQVGALILRGNRCVLARSVAGEWAGMRLPSLPALPGEPPAFTVGRAMETFTGADADDLELLEHVAPVYVYARHDGRPVLVCLYAAYAVDPPPDYGSPDDADAEDPEDDYDWYTFARAVDRVDAASASALRTMALGLVQGSEAGVVPVKWGGVFGQEMRVLDA
eukprot:CAMPEP_0194297466 /NCGR_PEP_ID=MMETSP0169-20130528/58968_1 /TAXON_ID=218684 /ORGANISM="Corethron pennatum, Strain L29A3" /LENGTH=487 /DNA_ID=CAMNT_0039047275 /DNA_START=246 /DNA_END=1709 /DNA_ORIENTATION=+